MAFPRIDLDQDTALVHPLKRAPPAPPGRHADTRRVRGVDNDAPPPRLMLFAVRNARPPLQASTAKSGLRERLPRRRAA